MSFIHTVTAKEPCVSYPGYLGVHFLFPHHTFNTSKQLFHVFGGEKKRAIFTKAALLVRDRMVITLPGFMTG